MEINYKIGEGNKHRVRIPLNCSVQILKELIAKDLQIASDFLTLSYKDTQLEDENSNIYFYGINSKHDIIDVSIPKVFLLGKQCLDTL
jgi:hypothetical protein